MHKPLKYTIHSLFVPDQLFLFNSKKKNNFSTMVKVDDEVRRTSIQVTTTDGDPSTWPDTNLRVRNGDYALFFYEVDEGSSVYKQWMETLGEVISDIEDTDGKKKIKNYLVFF